MRGIILRLCEQGYQPLGRLVRLLDRNPVALRTRFLAPMVEEGRLELRFPEPGKRNRPDQAYRTVADREGRQTGNDEGGGV